MAIAINVFKTVTANLTTVSSEIYTAPSGYTAVVLLAHVSNTGNSIVTVTSNHVRSGVQTNILTNAPLPPSDAMTLLSGKLILQTGDKVNIRASANAAAQIVLSILETANP
jgi:hypothetical protein